MTEHSVTQAPTSAADVFVARQPIFDADLQVFGYELLFRSGLETAFGGAESAAAHDESSQVVTDSMVTIGLDSLVGQHKAFINFTRPLLTSGLAHLLPRDRIVVEILEDIVPDPAVVEACQRLRKAGYQLALDDFALARREADPLVGHVDFIKVDFLANDSAERRKIIESLGDHGVRFLAEKVETQADFDEGRELGYDYFQGYFFQKPVTLSGRRLPGSKLHNLQLLQAIHQRDLDLTELESIIKRDLSLPMKLLKYINSAAFGWRHKIDSIRHALVLLGEREVRKWVSVVALSEMSEDKTPELVVSSVVRGHLCERLASEVGLQALRFDLFLTGLFSLLDAILDCPLDELLEDLPLPALVIDALRGDSNELRAVLDLVVAYESGRWPVVSQIAEELGLVEERIPASYIDAVRCGAGVRD